MGGMPDYPESVVEQALAHQVGDATIRAYRRGHAFLKRRLVVRDGANFIDGVKADQKTQKENICEKAPEQAHELLS